MHEAQPGQRSKLQGVLEHKQLAGIEFESDRQIQLVGMEKDMEAMVVPKGSI